MFFNCYIILLYFGGKIMEVFLDCLPCFLRQILDASRLVTDRTDLQAKIMKESIELISDYQNFRYSPEIGRALHQIVKRHTGIQDPYERIKKENILAAEKAYPLLKRFLSKKQEKIYWALKIAATGNIIDYAIYSDINLEDCIMHELEKKFSVCHIGSFKNKLKHAKNLLIIGDNAGETIFDRVLIEELSNIDITYAVRSEPIINDATIEDARASGLEHCTNLVSTGCNAPGLIIDECTTQFKDIFNNADIVISKGQGNYETLSEAKREMFFLLKAKCPVIADKLGVSVNDYVFKRNG
jgi:uncharacterized protein with ATP-grasp and redox domains